MRRILPSLLALTLVTSLSACGGVDGKTRSSLTEIIRLIKENKREELARHIVYRGADEARKWKTLCDYSVEEEKRAVDAVCKRMDRYLKLGEPTFVDYRSEKESEGTWLVWKVQFGEGDSAKSVFMACLEIDGTIALGDLDSAED